MWRFPNVGIVLASIMQGAIRKLKATTPIKIRGEGLKWSRNGDIIRLEILQYCDGKQLSLKVGPYYPDGLIGVYECAIDPHNGEMFLYLYGQGQIVLPAKSVRQWQSISSQEATLLQSKRKNTNVLGSDRTHEVLTPEFLDQLFSE